MKNTILELETAMSEKIIGKWIRGERIGRGGQSSVYEAHSGEGEPLRALKLINAVNPKKRQRFTQEVRKHIELSEKKTPHIIPILDHNLQEFVAGNKQGYIVMPKAEGTLEDFLSIVKGRVEICLEIFLGILNGIKEAHAIGVIHRDIKPLNILFGDKSLREPMVSDFGICFVKETDPELRVTEPFETVGARFFMAPEQEKGGVVDVNEMADIYALGKLFHYMITGRTLFREKLEEAFLEDEILNDPRLKLIHTEILANTIVLEPEKRFGSVQHLINAVKKINNQRTIVAQSISVIEDTKSSSSTNIDEQPLNVIMGNYRNVSSMLDERRMNSLKMYFDDCISSFQNYWKELRPSIEKQPHEAKRAAIDLINSQPKVVSLTLAVSRLNAVELFPEYKRLVGFVTRASEDHAGYVAVNSVPHLLSGFLYILANVTALAFQSWEILRELFCEKFEWYYQSKRPMFDYGFSIPLYFHSEVFSRNAPQIHEFCFERMSSDEYLKIFNLDAETLFNTYLQVQMLMSLRCAQEIQLGNESNIWPDFGRFHEYRVVPLLQRMSNNRDFAIGISRAFNETPDEWFKQLNSRLQFLQSDLFRSGGQFRWSSISSFDPDK